MTGEPITALPAQVFEGHPVGSGGKACCTVCKRTVREGDPAGVYVYRTSDAVAWDVARLSCAECRRLEIAHPTLGASELVLHCRLAVTADHATQTSRLTLRDPEVVARSPPGEGSEP